MPGFPLSCCWVAPPPHGLFQLCILRFPLRQRGNFHSMYLATSFVLRWCNQFPSCASCGSHPNSVLCPPGRLRDSLGWKCYSAAQAGDRQRFCICLCLAVRLPRCFQQLSSCSSVHCIIVGKVTDTLRWREICAGGQQSEVQCLQLLWCVQVLPDACSVSAILCIVLALPTLAGGN
jgi:hypothetical protein